MEVFFFARLCKHDKELIDPISENMGRTSARVCANAQQFLLRLLPTQWNACGNTRKDVVEEFSKLRADPAIARFPQGSESGVRTHFDGRTV